MRHLRHPAILRTAVALIAMAAAACAARAAGSDEAVVERVRAEAEWLAGFGTRVVGTDGHDRAIAGLIERIRAVPGARVWTRRFPILSPHTREATLTVTEGEPAGPHRVYPLWPSSVRLNTTPAGGISGRLVYAGRGSHDEIPVDRLRGAIAVMEMSGGQRWQQVWNAGARAIILLGSPEDEQADALSHLAPIPLVAPRFYVPDGPLADALRSGRADSGRLSASAEWREAAATNVWALVCPRSGAAGPALAIGVQADAVSVVPELAPGADAAVDAALGLELLRRCAADPPARPVLFAFFDAYAFDQAGVREMLATLMTTEDEWRAPRIEDEGRAARFRENEQLAAEVEAKGEAAKALRQPRYLPLYGYVRNEVNRDVLAVESEMYPLRLRLYNAEGEERERLRRRIGVLAEQRTQLMAAQQYLLAGKGVSPETEADARALWGRARRRIGREYAGAREAVEALDRRTALRRELLEALGTGPGIEFPIEFLLGLDLSDAGTAAGPMFYSRLWQSDETQNAMPLRQWLDGLTRGEGEPVWPEALARAVNLKPLGGLEKAASYTVGETPTLTVAAGHFSTPAATWATLDAPRRRVDTPEDRADRLDWGRLGPQVAATARLVDRLVRSEDFTAASRSGAKWRRVTGYVMDRVPGEAVSRLPMEGYLTCLVPGEARAGRAEVAASQAVAVGGIRQPQFVRTGADGRFVFDAVPVHEREKATKFFCQSYRLAPDGSVARALDLRKADKGTRLNVDILSQASTPLRGVVFDCTEIGVVGLFDPRYLQPLPSASLYDVRRGAEPQRLNLGLVGGNLAALVEPDMRWDLVLRAGATRNRMALLNAADPSGPSRDGETARDAILGFPAGAPLPMDPVTQAARDMYRLDRLRLDLHRRAGIVSRPIDEMQERTARLLSEAGRARASGDGAALAQASTGALANEIRVYHAVRDLASDTIRGAIFLLLLMIPFAFVMERLLVSTPRIYRQIVALLAIFLVMAAILWSFHPAFRISSQPLMIIMAFGILALGALVTGVVYAKFEAALEERRSGRAESSAARTARFGVLITAVRMGIANMRKRRLRTALTALTVVLVTFALMCFMSTSAYVGQRQYSIGAPAPYTGVLVRQPSHRPMSEEARRLLANALGPDLARSTRVWWMDVKEPRWRMHVRSAATGRQVSLHAALGLAAEEGPLTGLDRLLPRWERFARGRACYLSEPAAREIGASPGDSVLVAGQELELVGIYDPAKLDPPGGRTGGAETWPTRDLDGQPIFPVDLSAATDEQQQQLARTGLDVLAGEMESGGGMQEGSSLPALSSRSVAIVSPEVLEGLPRAQLRSLAVATDTAAAAEALALELAERVALPIYYGSPETGVRVVVSTPMLAGAPRNLWIPLLIGGLIILNTMLSAIAERRRDVYIYSSLGLAPLHVAALFVAEAVTYGLMGAVFGYIGGQAVATGLARLGWLGGLTLNYSGTHVVAVMLMVLVLVALSSLVPAYLAGRLAMPSSDRRWRVPEPDGDTIRDLLPFTVTGRAAGGLMMFLHEYFEVHRDGGVGHFTVDGLAATPESADGLESLRISGRVWLAPYDLGVWQDVSLSVEPGGEDDVYAIRIELVRGAGRERNWRSLNRTFIADLRRQLLGWRKLKSDRILAYIAQGRAALAGAAADTA